VPVYPEHPAPHPWILAQPADHGKMD